MISLASVRPALRTVEWKLALYRHVWRANLVSSFLQPLLYLLAIGLGVGTFVDRNAGSTEVLGGVSYLAFLGPALIATTAMMLCTIESSWPVMDGFKWNRCYQAMAATPISSGDIVVGHALWLALRCLLAGSMVALALVWFDETRSWGLVPAVASSVLCGVAFGMPLAAWAATREGEASFPAIQRFIVVPLFLFGGAFYPLSQLPATVRPIGYATPLWHGVELSRGLTLGTLELWRGIGHAGYLSLWVVAGSWIAARCYRERLYL